MLLAGDIGGTKTDLALYTAAAGPRAPMAQAEFPSQEYPSLEAMVTAFLGKTDTRVDSACFDVAGPVIDGVAKITNLPWLVDATKLQAELGLASVWLLNDLEAMAHAIPILAPEDLHVIAAGEPVAGGNLAVLAPGTGLGEAFLTWDGAAYVPHASEGGHADFAPTNETQIELLRYLQKRFDHVSFERVCSGIGIPNIYDFLRAGGYASEPAAIAARIAAAPDRTRAVLDIAVHEPESSPLCAATLEMFSSILGGEAGNLVLKVVATGGLYLAGGVATHILPALEKGTFLSSFLNKGRFRELLARVPVRLIVSQAALIGAASYGLKLAAAGDNRHTT